MAEKKCRKQMMGSERDSERERENEIDFNCSIQMIMSRTSLRWNVIPNLKEEDNSGDGNEKTQNNFNKPTQKKTVAQCYEFNAFAMR